MVSLISPTKAQRKIVNNVRDRRLLLELTQEDLAERSGVALATFRKFEQKGLISLASFLKLLWVMGGIEELMSGLTPPKPVFNSIDEVLKKEHKIIRKRGRKK